MAVQHKQENMMKKQSTKTEVTFQDLGIMVNGIRVGTVTKGSEVIVSIQKSTYPFDVKLASFKYGNNRKLATDMVKIVFSQLSIDEIIKRTQATSFRQLARELGFSSLPKQYTNKD